MVHIISKIKKSKTRFQILSDIHLEKKNYNNKILEHPIKAENLILAGDIGNPLVSNYNEYIKYCSNQYERVFLITGNHEYWKNSYDGTNQLISNICKKYKNVYFLNNNFIDFENNNKSIRIFGGTMWSEISNNHSLYNKPLISTDNRLINGFNFDRRNKIFYDTIKNISSRKSDIIITHHSPTYKLIHSNYANYINNNLFASNIEYLLQNTKFWICGHLHETNNLTEFNNLNKKIIVNCCHNGYNEKIIELD
jgi:predicted phosphohydrolase